MRRKVAREVLTVAGTRLMPYASTPGRAFVQLAVDVSVILWIAVWIVVGRFVHAAIASFAEVGRKVDSGAGGIASNLDQAGNSAAKVPLVGDTLKTPLQAAGNAASDLASAGQGLEDKATWLAVVLALAVAVPPILGVVVPWLALRFRFARRAGATADLAATPGGERLLALRALANRPLPRLQTLDEDPLEAWRRDDPEVVARLAALELRASGVRVPRGMAAQARGDRPRGLLGRRRKAISR
jgi:hypothetical protein